MKKIIPFFLFLVLSLSLSAQLQRGLKGTLNLDGFPEVSFVWTTPNNELLDASRFALFEDDIAVAPRITPLQADLNVDLNKSILILWEDMYSHSRQSDYTREILTQFFSDSVIFPNDCFEIAVFNRTKENSKKVLEPLVGYFTQDTSVLNGVVSNYQNDHHYYYPAPTQSNLYQAIEEGIQMLKKEPVGRSGVIIVFTAGLDNKTSGSITEMEVRQEALEAGIPVYVIRYPLKGNSSEIVTLSEKTFGRDTATTDISDALYFLEMNYLKMDRYLQGQDYEISFTSNCEHDGKQHNLCLTVDKVSQIQLSFDAPKATFGMWLMKFWWVAVLVLILLGAGSFFLVSWLMKKKKERDQAAQSLQNQLRREREESDRRHNEAMEGLRREQRDKDRAAIEKSKREQDAANEKRLNNLMQTKNLYPRLKCKCGKQSFSYTITKPCVTLGRDSDNDISFNSQTVSGHHAEIIFNGSAFEAVNKSYSYQQGIVVNGQFHQKYTLSNGDMIGIGEAIITFYV